jgi:hypothetical protein
MEGVSEELGGSGGEKQPRDEAIPLQARQRAAA